MLSNMNLPKFDLCFRCKQAILVKRLRLAPQSRFCVKCV